MPFVETTPSGSNIYKTGRSRTLAFIVRFYGCTGSGTSSVSFSFPFCGASLNAIVKGGSSPVSAVVSNGYGASDGGVLTSTHIFQGDAIPSDTGLYVALVIDVEEYFEVTVAPLDPSGNPIRDPDYLYVYDSTGATRFNTGPYWTQVRFFEKTKLGGRSLATALMTKGPSFESFFVGNNDQLDPMYPFTSPNILSVVGSASSAITSSVEVDYLFAIALITTGACAFNAAFHLQDNYLLDISCPYAPGTFETYVDGVQANYQSIENNPPGSVKMPPWVGAPLKYNDSGATVDFQTGLSVLTSGARINMAADLWVPRRGRIQGITTIDGTGVIHGAHPIVDTDGFDIVWYNIPTAWDSSGVPTAWQKMATSGSTGFGTVVINEVSDDVLHPLGVSIQRRWGVFGTVGTMEVFSNVNEQFPMYVSLDKSKMANIRTDYLNDWRCLFHGRSFSAFAFNGFPDSLKDTQLLLIDSCQSLDGWTHGSETTLNSNGIVVDCTSTGKTITKTLSTPISINERSVIYITIPCSNSVSPSVTLLTTTNSRSGISTTRGYAQNIPASNILIGGSGVSTVAYDLCLVPTNSGPVQIGVDKDLDSLYFLSITMPSGGVYTIENISIGFDPRPIVSMSSEYDPFIFYGGVGAIRSQIGYKGSPVQPTVSDLIQKINDLPNFTATPTEAFPPDGYHNLGLPSFCLEGSGALFAPNHLDFKTSTTGGVNIYTDFGGFDPSWSERDNLADFTYPAYAQSLFDQISWYPGCGNPFNFTDGYSIPGIATSPEFSESISIPYYLSGSERFQPEDDDSLPLGVSSNPFFVDRPFPLNFWHNFKVPISSSEGDSPTNYHSPSGSYFRARAIAGNIYIWRSYTPVPKQWVLNQLPVTSQGTDSHPRIIVDDYFRIDIAFSRMSSGSDTQGIYLASSEDDGNTWSEPQLILAGASFPCMAIDQDGTRIIAGIVDGNIVAVTRASGATDYSASFTLTQYISVIDLTHLFVGQYPIIPSSAPFSISAGPDSQGRWVLAIIEDGNTDVSEFFSKDNGKTWTKTNPTEGFVFNSV